MVAHDGAHVADETIHGRWVEIAVRLRNRELVGGRHSAEAGAAIGARNFTDGSMHEEVGKHRARRGGLDSRLLSVLDKGLNEVNE